MFKKTLVIFLTALLLIMPLAQVSAQAADSDIDKVLTYIDGKIGAIGKDNAANLIDVVKKIYGAQALKTLFNNLDASFKDRLSSKGISQTSLTNAADTAEGDGFYTATKTYINDKKRTVYEPELRAEFNKIFKKSGAPLEDLYETIITDFGSWKSFLSDLKTLENNLLTLNEEGSLIIEYSEATKKLSINEEKSKEEITKNLNDFLPKDIALSDTETASLIQGTNAVLADLSSTDTNTLKNALKSLNYNITTIPKSDDPGTDPGDKPGGGGKGEPTTPDKPEVVIPKDPDKPVSVSIPSDSAKVTVTDGKTVVSFDDTTVSDILKLLEDAQKKADDKPLVLTFDFSTIGKVEDNVEVNLPANLIAQAFEAEAPITVTLKSIIIDIPVSAMNLDDAKDFNINAQTVEPNEALTGISGLDNMKTVGNAQEITITIDGKAANLNKKITIKFNIKGIATNIDKLGVYFVDTENGTLVFVGGKVDRATGTIKAELPHLSTYALLEYDRTFGDVKYHWAKNFIESMASKHILDGKAQDKFAPEDSMNRAEFAKVIVQALSLDIKTYRGSFEDISTGDWFADYVQTAFDNNLIQGKVAGKLFDPNGKITRQEMMTIIGRAMGEKAIRDANSILGYYKDADKVADFAKDFVALLIEKQLVGGYPDMTLKPEASINRAEAAKIIYGFYNY